MTREKRKRKQKNENEKGRGEGDEVEESVNQGDQGNQTVINNRKLS